MPKWPPPAFESWYDSKRSFVYAGENVNDIPQQFDSQSFTYVCALEKISELQKQCPYFGPIYEFLKNGTLPADKNNASQCWFFFPGLWSTLNLYSWSFKAHLINRLFVQQSLIFIFI
jgi:hypothetical protein